MSEFACWDVLNSEAADAKTLIALTSRDAAVKHAEWIWACGDYPNEMNIAVRDDRGDVRVFVVEARQEVNFYATLKSGKGAFL